MPHTKKYNAWLQSPAIKSAEKAELQGLAPADIADRFYKDLEFGTAGLRGLVEMGTNRMNIYTLRRAAKAFGKAIMAIEREGGRLGTPKMCICYDYRLSSREFAKEAAAMLAGMGVEVHMFLNPRPTPQLSFAIRRLNCAGGINITASHNPKEYNGFKAYVRGGVQLDDAVAAKVTAFSAEIDPLTCQSDISFQRAVDEKKVIFIGPQNDDDYISACLSAVFVEKDDPVTNNLSVVYSAFHGVGGAIFPKTLQRAGFNNIHPVAEQIEGDGAFPTLASPNPEDESGFDLSIKLAKEINADIIIGTDPDADRVAAVAKDSMGRWKPLSGNQMGGLLLDFIIKKLKEKGQMPQNPALVQTIVTGGLTLAIAQKHGIEINECFTGFRFIAAKADEIKSRGGSVILAYEEAIGYMVGDHVRDKDGITAGLLIAQMAAHYKAKGMSLWDALHLLWREYGFFAERTLSISMPGADGAKKMRKIMGCMANLPPKVINDIPVIMAKNFKTGAQINFETGSKTHLKDKGMNVLHYTLKDGSVFILRPSGTEPKIKVYIKTAGKTIEDAQNKAACFAQKAGETLRINQD